MAYKILDISKYQPNVDYAKTAKDVDGVILRIGLTYWGAQEMGADPCFEQHYKGFKDVGCPVGVYYYSAADSVAVAEKEADYCLSLIKGKQFELPIYYDVENNQRQGGLSKQLLTDIVDTFCRKVQNAGYFVGFYASTSWLLNKMDVAVLGQKYTLWKADYRTYYDKTIYCDMHQYTSTGTVDGINGNVDLSHCYVDFPSIIKSGGFNGFNAEAVEPSAPTEYEPSRLIIGPMSTGDRIVFTTLLDGLGIKYEVTTEGHIITRNEVSYGDVVKIEAKANDVGNIDVDVYVPNVEQPETCAECDLMEAEVAKLKAEIKTLQAELVAEHEAKVYAQETSAAMAENYGRISAELTVANNALAAERAVSDALKNENSIIAEKLAKIKEIVGG